ncbi:MAG: hypothetical protein ACREOC_01545 [Gemmatimonadales bacterium]
MRKRVVGAAPGEGVADEVQYTFGPGGATNEVEDAEWRLAS